MKSTSRNTAVPKVGEIDDTLFEMEEKVHIQDSVHIPEAQEVR